MQNKGIIYENCSAWLSVLVLISSTVFLISACNSGCNDLKGKAERHNRLIEYLMKKGDHFAISVELAAYDKELAECKVLTADEKKHEAERVLMNSKLESIEKAQAELEKSRAEKEAQDRLRKTVDLTFASVTFNQKDITCGLYTPAKQSGKSLYPIGGALNYRYVVTKASVFVEKETDNGAFPEWAALCK